jgi:hypothetical protein
MQMLPMEVIDIILDYLSIEELIENRFICKLWGQLIRTIFMHRIPKYFTANLVNQWTSECEIWKGPRGDWGTKYHLHIKEIGQMAVEELKLHGM